MRTNKLKRTLERGGVGVGCLLAYDAPWLVEVLGVTGYDFVTIDLEHEPIDPASVASLIRAADGVGLTTIVRMECTDRVIPYLSAGAQGIQVPDLRGKDHAEEIVARVRFPPLGRRTYYTQTRGADYGVGIEEPSWTDQADQELLVIAMIEDAAIVDRLDQILRVDGIDAFHVGPLDLAQSLGNPEPAELEAVIDQIVVRCRRAGKHVAVGVITPWGVNAVGPGVGQGVNIVTVASAWLVTHAFASLLAEIEQRVPARLREPSARSVTPNPYLSHRTSAAPRPAP
jgi:2-keto-3-deoxy-L-rhamnonate aldolase RhmA